MPLLLRSIRDGTMPRSNLDDAREYTTLPGFSLAWMVTRSELNHRKRFHNTRPAYPTVRLGDAVLALLHLAEAIDHASPQKAPADTAPAEPAALTSEMSPEQLKKNAQMNHQVDRLVSTKNAMQHRPLPPPPR